MRSERVQSALKDIKESIDLALNFSDGHGKRDFGADRRTFFAVVRCLEIISEASRRLPDDLKLRHPSIPWHQIAGAGNIYRHDYGALAPDRVWDTVHVALPQLRAVIDLELAAGE